MSNLVIIHKFNPKTLRAKTPKKEKWKSRREERQRNAQVFVCSLSLSLMNFCFSSLLPFSSLRLGDLRIIQVKYDLPIRHATHNPERSKIFDIYAYSDYTVLYRDGIF